jgi:hypothetical protein
MGFRSGAAGPLGALGQSMMCRYTIGAINVRRRPWHMLSSLSSTVALSALLKVTVRQQ